MRHLLRKGARAGLCIALLGLGLAAAPSASGAAEPLKVAFVYLGPVGDGGWTYQHDQGRIALQKALGDKIKTFVENVPESADSERVFRQLAADGNSLIFACSFGYMEPLLKVAKQFPNVHFEHVNGYKTAANVVTYEPRFEEGFYLLGVVAGKMTKSNTLGFLGSFPIPSVVRDADAFTLGAQSVNPNVKTKVIWADTWYDPGKERQAAEALAGLGSDVIAQNTDSPASIQVAQEKGIYAFSIDSDMTKYGPKSHLTGTTEDWSGYYIQETKKVLDGTWTGNRQTRWGIKEGLVVMAPLNPAIPADTVKIFEEKKKAIADGSLNPFKGPITDNTGVVKLAAGATLPMGEFMSINWYVKGVDGSVPK
jgi:simple sugar transport system substrate-binding protein